ncbi:MAG TPA: 4Fe-4S binding protein [Thermodesulfovibrionales bacterium]|nr:4Fe-4S binding protein [Thermodesulfovibrionales bacterium]
MSRERRYIRTFRYVIQLAFLLFVLFIGYRFYQFVLHFENNAYPFFERPSSVDAFLPISGLMALKYFLFTGVVDPVHPAGLILFVSAMGVSLVMKKGFCGWICPVGTVSQFFWMTGKRIFGRNFNIGKSTDTSLRSLKYILMALFLVSIGIIMPLNMIVLFFITDYYKIVDVRMLKFFTEMSQITFWVLLVHCGLSLLYKNFWCRYLCPYGALLGLLSYLSPFKIRRKEENCVHCHSCTENCPSLIVVENQDTVKSPECFACMTCVSRCPSEGALDITLGTRKNSRTLRPYLYPIILLLIIFLTIGAAMVTGNWHSQLPYEEYQRIIPEFSKHGD